MSDYNRVHPVTRLSKETAHTPMYSIRDFAERYHTSIATVGKWSKMEGFPKPGAITRCGPFKVPKHMYVLGPVDMWVKDHKPKYWRLSTQSTELSTAL